MNINAEWIPIALIAAAVLAIIGLVAVGVRRFRTTRLRQHFGREYDHAIRTTGSRAAAEQELVARAEEVKQFDIRPLTAMERQNDREAWKRIEGRFIERPTTALVEADELVNEVMRARGYPMADFDQHAAHLSVKHPRVVDHYRAGHRVIEAHARAAATTEDLRQGMLDYRALFEELVNEGTDVATEIPTSRELAEPASTRSQTASEIRVSEERPNH